MSRIHEALLKAQRERGAIEGAPAEEAPPLEPVAAADLIEADAPAAPAVEDPSVHETAIAPPKTTPEVVAAAAAAEWTPDRSRLVFFKDDTAANIGVEEFRAVRSRLYRERAQRNLKSVLVTSAAPGEGKSFVSANLAVALSRQPGSRILLVDADLRRSSLHEFFGYDVAPGLSDYLQGHVPLNSAIRQTPEPELCVITAGTRSEKATEMLQSRRMKEFLQVVTGQYEWVVLDSPPATLVSDSSVLSELVDGLLFVIAPGTPIDMAQKLRREFAHKPVLGVVLNRLNSVPKYDQYYRGSKAEKKKSKA
jgi:protein-tyrosine kinase